MLNRSKLEIQLEARGETFVGQKFASPVLQLNCAGLDAHGMYTICALLTFYQQTELEEFSRDLRHGEDHDTPR